MNYIDEIAEELRAEVSRIKGRPTATDDLLLRIYAVMIWNRRFGENTTLEDIHDFWAAWKPDRSNPNIIPFDELPADEQVKDWPYLEAIHIVAKRRGAKQ